MSQDNILIKEMPNTKKTPKSTYKKKGSPRSRERNTILKDSSRQRKRARRWCFTLNNHTREDCVSLSQRFLEISVIDYVFQEEQGLSGTPHIQGCIEFKNQVSFSTLKRFDKRIHWEICRNWAASKIYCSKKETRAGSVFIMKKKTTTPTVGDEEMWLEYVYLNSRPNIDMSTVCMCNTYYCLCEGTKTPTGTKER